MVCEFMYFPALYMLCFGNERPQSVGNGVRGIVNCIVYAWLREVLS